MYTPRYLDVIEQRRAGIRESLGRALPEGRGFVLEVGCGHGHFLTAYAERHPQLLCIGIDIIGERIERAIRKRDRAKLGNLHFLHAEARLFLDTLGRTNQIEQVFILFPDPWPKLRHNKHRILQPSFLAQVAEHAVPDCPLYFRTDYTPYFEAARDTVRADPFWRLTEETWPFEYATVFQQRADVHHSLIARHKPKHSLASS